MAYLKGVDLSGSSDISGSIGIFGDVTGSSFTGSFTGSFLGDVIGTISTASYVDYDNVANKPTLISSSDQIASNISGAFTSDSASFSTRVTDLETFSSSLDDTFVTETELNAATASLSSSLATDIATKANSASFATDIATLDSTTVKLTGDQSIAGTKTFTGAITASDLRVTNTASIGYLQTIYETSSIIYSSGSTKFGDTLDDTHQITGSLLVTGSSYTINGEDIIITSALNASTSSLSSSLATGIASDSASLAASIVSNSSSLAASITTNSSSAATDIAALVVDSGSFSTRVTDLETFSSSLDDTFATEAELNAATASLSSSLAVDIATKANSASFATDIASLTTDSGSFSTRVTDLETFSSSLDDTFVTETELNTATASLSSSLATDIATKANSASFATDIASLVTDSGSFSTRVTDLETFSSSLDDTFTTEAELNAATASLSSSLAVDIAANSASISNIESFPYTGSAIISGSLIVTGSTNISGSVTAYGFNIDDNATGTPALYSSTNLNLSASNAVVVTSSPFRVASLTTTERGTFTAQDGDIIFNTTVGKYQVYSGSAWTNLLQTEDKYDEITVTVVNDGGNKYAFDGVTAPKLSLNKGTTYRFDLSDSSNSGHPFAFRLPDDTSYTTGVTTVGTAGNTGAYVEFDVDFATSSSLKYYCTVHGNGMGNVVQLIDLYDLVATGSLQGTATTASYIAGANVDGTVTSASYAITASYAENVPSGTGFPYTGSAIVSGSLNVTGSVEFSYLTGGGAGSWSAGGALIQGRNSNAGAGTQNAGLAIGGKAPAAISCTEEYDGSSWTAGGALITGRFDLSGAGTQDAALAFAGRDPSTKTCTEEYNGSSWSAGGALIIARETGAGAGTQNAGIMAGGMSGPSNIRACTEEYNGTSWSTGGALINSRRYLAGAGTQNAMLAFGGNPSYSGLTEEYDGASWSAGGAMIAARAYLAGAGTQNAGLGFGGYGPAPANNQGNTEEYNGSSWTAGSALNSARYLLGGAGTQNAALAFGGNGNVTCTEEYSTGAPSPIKTFSYSSTTGEISTTGSFTGSFVGNGSGLTGITTAQTASYIAGANIDGTVTSASYAITSSYPLEGFIDVSSNGLDFTFTRGNQTTEVVQATITGSVENAVSASYAVTASHALNGGVTSIIAGSGITVSNSTGNITISSETIVGGSIATGSFSDVLQTSLIHNFGSTNILVAVYDSNGNEIIPATVTLDSDNQTTATFASTQTGTIVVIEAQSGEYASTQFTSTGSVTLNHGLGTQDLNVVAYDSNNAQFYPDIDIIDSSNVKATFASPSTGTLLAVVREGTVSSSFSNTVDTTITHNLSSSAVIASVYDTSYNKIIPSEVSIVDTSSINLTFASTSSGNVVIVGGPIDTTNVTTATSFTQVITGSSSYTVDHNLNSEWPLVQVYESSSRAQYVPQSIVSVNANSVQLTFSTTFDGVVSINS